MEKLNPAHLREAMLRAVNQRATSDDFDPHAHLKDLLAIVGLSPEDCGGRITFSRKDPLFPSTIRLGGLPAIALVAQSVAAAKLWRMRGGLGQDISVDLGQAARRLAPINEFKWEMLNGLPNDLEDRNTLAFQSYYKTKDGRHVLPQNIYPGVRAKMLKILDCSDSPQALAKVFLKCTGDELEALGEQHGLVMVKVRSVEEFIREPVFDYLASLPLIELEKVGDSPPEPLPGWGTQPLSGVRALGMAHVIAGAGFGRSLASLGADCLNVWRFQEIEQALMFTSSNIGVRSTRLNVRSEDGRERFYELLRDADIFYANRRPGLLKELGADLESAIKVRPGLIHVTFSLWGEGGPWSKRIGFDQCAGSATGMSAAEGSLDDPKLPPTGIINDYLCGWLATVGAMAALARRATEGGSYRVHASLGRCAMWCTSLGLFDWNYVNKVVGTGGEHELIDPQLFTSLTPMGIYQGLTENVTLSRTPHHYMNVLSPRGADQPAWLPRPKKFDSEAFFKAVAAHMSQA
ncbi:MAG TPA: CoA transferase [Povalibacter sp.]|uniref:CoA transferase n=1 Tax=Povalibacter sp. TaxID=1962978 RepID=UPI002C3B599E|nr:CoA transferase [Povalibacter sp.]HMN45872.1 CoA transferase [Povalibacter sp.]